MRRFMCAFTLYCMFTNKILNFLSLNLLLQLIISNPIVTGFFDDELRFRMMFMSSLY